MQIEDINSIELLRRHTLQDAADAISQTEMQSETEAPLSRRWTSPDLVEDSLGSAACTATHPEKEDTSSNGSTSGSGARKVTHSNSPPTTLGEDHEDGHENGVGDDTKGGIPEEGKPLELPRSAASYHRGPCSLDLGAFFGGVSNPDSSPPRAPPSCMGQVVPYSTWLELGLDIAPFTVQSCAPMSLVHFYFSQLTLSCVFVVDKGRFTGMITKADIVRGGF